MQDDPREAAASSSAAASRGAVAAKRRTRARARRQRLMQARCAASNRQSRIGRRVAIESGGTLTDWMHITIPMD